MLADRDTPASRARCDDSSLFRSGGGCGRGRPNWERQRAAQIATDTEPGQTSSAPVITAKPEHVTITRGSGSTEIHWDTGNGSMGLVFVTGTDQKPVLFASGAKGTQLV